MAKGGYNQEGRDHLLGPLARALVAVEERDWAANRSDHGSC